ncbi:MAG: T9SS type A sorting domain-containing protein, partial [Ignavibacteria bacterium]|nr:T9SS type A sorting domain-containing protein [Ignavibacteria bacterium]
NLSVNVIAPFSDNVRYIWDTISTYNVTAPFDYFIGAANSINGVIPAGTTLSTILNNNSFADTGYINFKITPRYDYGSGSCNGKPINTSLRIFPSPPPLDVLGPTSICNQQTDLIYNINNPEPFVFYSWTTNSGSQVAYFENFTNGGTPDSTNSIIQFAPPFSNPLYLTVSGKYPQYGCPADTTITIIVDQQTNAPELRDVILFTTNPLIKLAVTYTDNGPQQYKWFSINKNLDINSISAIIGTDQILTFNNTASFDTANVFYYVEYSDGNDCWQSAFYNTPPKGNTLTSLNKIFTDYSFFEIFPNPANKNFNINFNGNDETGIVEIISLTGKVIAHIKISHKKNILINDDGNFSKGIYLVRYINSNGISQSRKLIIQ